MAVSQVRDCKICTLSHKSCFGRVFTERAIVRIWKAWVNLTQNFEQWSILHQGVESFDVFLCCFAQLLRAVHKLL